MANNKLREIFNFGGFNNLITEKEKLPKYALAKLGFSFAKADEKNLNNREYPESILMREIARKNEELKSQKLAGQLDHPLSGNTELDKTAHILNSISYDKNTKVASAESYIIDTTGGHNFMTLLKTGLKMGASMRGFGNVGGDRKIQGDYKLDTIDLVLKPSFGANASIDQSNILESANSLLTIPKNTGVNMDNFKVKNLENLMLYMYGSDFDDDRFSGSFEEWKKENEDRVKAAVLSEEEGIEFNEALLRVGGKQLVEKTSRLEEIPLKVEPKDVVFEAMIAGVSPKELALKLNENIERKEKEILNENTENRKALYKEIKLAMGNATTEEIHEKMEKIEEIENQNKDSKSDIKILTEEEQKKEYKQKKINSLTKELREAGANHDQIKKIVERELNKE